MKRLILCLLVLALLPSFALAGAKTPQTYAFAPAYLQFIGNASPLDDGSVLLSGGVLLPGEEDNLPMDGYAALLAPDGSIMWERQLKHPEGGNSLIYCGEIVEGRILLRRYGFDTGEGNDGNAYLIVDRNTGETIEEIPFSKLAEFFPPLTLALMPDGYMGGGDTGATTAVCLDFDMNAKWSLDLVPYAEDADYTFWRLSNGDTVLSGVAAQGEGEARQWRLSILRVDGEGRVLWHYDGVPGSSPRGAWYFAEDNEGNLAFVTAAPLGAAGTKNEHAMKLACLDAQGMLLQERLLAEILGSAGLPIDAGLTGFVPFDGGLLVSVQDTPQTGVLVHMDFEGNVLGHMLVNAPEGYTMMALGIYHSNDGGHVIATGQLVAANDGLETLTLGPVFYLWITPEVLT